MNHLSFIIVFLAGLLSFFSPCVLPLIPVYVSYLTGSAIADLNTNKARLNLLYKSMGFVVGFTFIFIIMGASVSSLGKIFAAHQLLFRKMSGIIIIILGLHTTGIYKIKSLYAEKKLLPFHNNGRNLSSVLIGMAFAAGWTPCIGPILSSVLIYAGNMETIGKGIGLLLIYSLGLAIPFILTAVSISSFSKTFHKFSRYLPVISMISGILMITMGVLIFTNKLALLSRYFNFINFY